jgi:hypothetical protein
VDDDRLIRIISNALGVVLILAVIAVAAAFFLVGTGQAPFK